MSTVNPNLPVAQGLGTIPATRLKSSVGQIGESTQRAAQDFVNNLPSSVRERIGQPPREDFRRNNFTSLDEEQADEKNVFDAASVLNDASGPISDTIDEPAYSAPVFAANLTLLQAQLSQADNENDGVKSFSAAQVEQFFGAYINAGAQPGGENAAFEAQLRREEQEQKTYIVPPILTSINLLS